LRDSRSAVHERFITVEDGDGMWFV
jgi:hypothetical protein